MKVVVVGGTGNLGYQLTRELAADGHDVISIQRNDSESYPNVRYQKGDIRYPGKWCESIADAEVVFHLASVTNEASMKTKRDRSRLWEVNVNGLRNVLRACEGSRVKKVVLASSVSVYAEAFTDAREDDPLNGSTPYARSKIEMESLVREQCESIGIKWTILRLAPIVAPAGKGNLNRLSRAVLNRKLPLVPYLDSRTSMVSVDTAAEGMMRCGFDSRADNKIFNLAEDDEISVPQLLGWITDGRPELMPQKLPSIVWYPIRLADQCFSILGLWRLLGRESPISRLAEVRTVSNEKIKNALDWEIPRRLKQAVSDLVAAEKESMNKEIPPV